MKPETKSLLMWVCLILIAFLIGMMQGKRGMEEEINSFIIEEYYSMGYEECISWCNGYEGTSINWNGEIITPFSKKDTSWSYNDGVDIE